MKVWFLSEGIVDESGPLMTFIASTGRCGTGYLAKMLETIPGMLSLHEPRPRLNTPQRANLVDWWQATKLPWIERAMEGYSWYVETSHLFIDGHADALWQLDIPFGLVFLTRPHREVALSLWRRRSIPGRTRRGRAYLLDPAQRAPDGWQDWTGYQLCYWHCLETRREQERLWSLHEGCWITLTELTTEEGFRRLLREMEWPDADWRLYRQRMGWQVNANPENYYDVWPEEDMAEAERGVEAAMKEEQPCPTTIS